MIERTIPIWISHSMCKRSKELHTIYLIYLVQWNMSPILYPFSFIVSIFFHHKALLYHICWIFTYNTLAYFLFLLVCFSSFFFIYIKWFVWEFLFVCSISSAMCVLDISLSLSFFHNMIVFADCCREKMLSLSNRLSSWWTWRDKLTLQDVMR